MFTTYNQVKSVCDLFISCTRLAFVNNGKVSHESDLTSFKGPKLWIKGKPLRQDFSSLCVWTSQHK